MGIQNQLFARTVRTTSGCLEFQGVRDKAGYGLVNLAGKMTRTHRAVYEYAVGRIPEGMFVCHTCDNPPCCNPEHLFTGTHQDNMRDRKLKGRQSKGERHGCARLTERLVNEIRYFASLGVFRQRHLAALYGVSQSQISHVVRGVQWNRDF